MIAGGTTTDRAGEPHSRIAVAVADGARRAIQADLDADRWMSDGGAFASEAAVPLRAVARRS